MRKFCIVCGRPSEEALCNNCFKDKTETKKLEITMCPRCGRIKFANLWRSISADDVLKKLGHERESVTLHFNKIICTECLKKAGGYYEAIVQLRGCDEKIIKYVLEELKKKTFYKIEKVKTGLDLYAGSRFAASSVARQVKKLFKVELKKSYKLFTKKDGRDIKRMTISLRAKQFKQ